MKRHHSYEFFPEEEEEDRWAIIPQAQEGWSRITW
jgi:hypothetical protein